MFINNLSSLSELQSVNLFRLGFLTSTVLLDSLEIKKNVSLKRFEIKTINQMHDLKIVILNPVIYSRAHQC